MQRNLATLKIKKIPKNLIDKIGGTFVNVGNFSKGSYFKNEKAYIFLTDLENINALAVSVTSEDLAFARANDFSLEINKDTEIVDLYLDSCQVDLKDLEEEIYRLKPQVGIFGKNESMVEALPRIEERINSKGLKSLVGLGLGLTPSGDDFLAGLLALQFATGRIFLKEDLDLKSTNYISGEFLSYAQEGIFSEDIKRLFTEDVSFAKEILKSGHSSGADTLFGIYYGLQILKNLKED